MTILFIASCCAFVAVLLFAEWRDQPLVKAISKALAAISFVAVGFSEGLAGTALGQWILAGLVLSVFGDVFLLSQRTTWFLAGMGAFGAAHIAYLGGFLGTGLPTTTGWVLGAVSAAVLCLGSYLWMWPKLGAMRLPVLGYVIIIGLMVCTGIAGGLSGTLNVGLMLAAIIFAVSDLFVARDRFILSSFLNRLIGLPLYFGAQLLFALSA